MRPRTRSALTAFAGALVAAAVLGTPSTAQAAPEATNYPAPEPAVRVSSATVGTGDSVRLQGKDFLPGEPIGINVQYRVTHRSGGFDSPFPARVSGDRRADDQGRMSARIRLTSPGYATITVTGRRSHQSACVTVRVVAWRGTFTFGGGDIFAGTPLGNGVDRRNNGQWDGGDRPAGFFGPFYGGWSPFRLSAQETTLAVSGSTTGGGAHGADLVASLLGLTALAGSGFVLRRRRRVS